MTREKKKKKKKKARAPSSQVVSLSRARWASRMRPACAPQAHVATTGVPAAAAAAARRRLLLLAGRRMRVGTTTAPTARQLHASAAHTAADQPSTSSMDAASAAPSKRRPMPSPGAPKVLILAGPTAVGKTAVSLALGNALANGGPPGSGLGPVEIVNADSVQVYKGLDVGSDKVGTKEERRKRRGWWRAWGVARRLETGRRKLTPPLPPLISSRPTSAAASRTTSWTSWTRPSMTGRPAPSTRPPRSPSATSSAAGGRPW